MKIRILFFPKVPWNECELCFIGPGIVNYGDQIVLSLGLFFIEIGVEFSWREHEPDS
jgi:hypothetical protein